jgi:SAM-dependent methyltransferase
VKADHPQFFIDVNALDVGSLDINGSNRELFTGEKMSYVGIDVAPGKNVDAVSKGHEWAAADSNYDTIISTECFEHDMFYALTLKNIVRMLKPGGLFLFTCATTGRREHGTKRTTCSDSPFTSQMEGWCDYYKNLVESDIREAIDVDAVFAEYKFSECYVTADLYFYGIKR